MANAVTFPQTAVLLLGLEKLMFCGRPQAGPGFQAEDQSVLLP